MGDYREIARIAFPPRNMHSGVINYQLRATHNLLSRGPANKTVDTRRVRPTRRSRDRRVRGAGAGEAGAAVGWGGLDAHEAIAPQPSTVPPDARRETQPKDADAHLWISHRVGANVSSVGAAASSWGLKGTRTGAAREGRRLASRDGTIR